MSKLSPSLNSRFANIDIESQNRNRHLQTNKDCPAQAYANSNQIRTTTTPCKAPVLSTARRAETRSYAPRKENDRKEPPVKTGTRESHPHLSASRSQYSFMKETSSSRKKQHTLPRHNLVPRLRVLSYPEPSKETPATRYRAKPVMATPNLSFLSNNPFRDSVPLPIPPASASTVPSAKPGPWRSTPDSVHSPSRNLRNTSPNPRTYVPSRRVSPTESLLRPNPKVSSRNEMYNAIWRADPSLFQDFHSLDPELEKNEPIYPHELHKYPDLAGLNVYERGEVMRKQQLYFLPRFASEAASQQQEYKNNFGFDDENGNYIIRKNAHIEYRYEILKTLGTGSFGNVVLCVDHKYSNPVKQRKVAIKIIKNEINWSLQAVSEIKMLRQLSQPKDGSSSNLIMKYCDHFNFRGHMCIVTEVLSLNLYTFLELIGFKGVSLSLLREFALDLAQGLQFIHQHGVIHCDIKPENLMIKLPPGFDPLDITTDHNFGVKIIDFGSSCFESETSFSYIQSRFYRAPEVILGAKYSRQIDIWSLGCVLAELYTGAPLLPGKTELEQIALILELFGPPSSSYILDERKKLSQKLRGGSTKELQNSLTDTSFLTQQFSVLDDRQIKKTLLYSLFNYEGKINLPFLNQQLQNSQRTGGPGMAKKTVKLSSRSLETTLRLHNCDDPAAPAFSKLMLSIFTWNPHRRPQCGNILDSAFLRQAS